LRRAMPPTGSDSGTTRVHRCPMLPSLGSSRAHPCQAPHPTQQRARQAPSAAPTRPHQAPANTEYGAEDPSALPRKRRPAKQTPQPTSYPQHGRRECVRPEYRQQHRWRIERDKDEEQGDDQDIYKLHTPIEIELLEAREAEATDHQRTGEGSQEQRSDET